MLRKVALCLLLLPGPCLAQDTELHVVLHIAPHRLLGPAFRNHLKSDLAVALGSAFAGAANVRIFDVASARPTDRLPAWDAAERLGLEQLERIEKAERVKTHFVNIDIVEGQYRIRSRQLDGRLGWASPVVRDDRTGDSTTVLRIVLAQLIADFGLTGVVTQSDGDRAASITFRGSSLPDERLREWVRTGDVFAILQVGGSRASEVPHAYFVATGAVGNGSASGRIESRFTNPLAAWENGAYRLVKLGATSGPVRLRLVGPDGTTPAELNVRLSSTGTTKADPVKEQGPCRGGRFVSAEKYDRLAFATLALGERVLTCVPVAVVGSLPATIEISTDPNGEATAAGEADSRALRSRLHDLLARLGEEKEELRALMSAVKNRQAQAKVKALLTRLEEEIPRLAGDAAVLRARAVGTSTALDEVDRGVRTAKQEEAALHELRSKLDRALDGSAKSEPDQRRDALQALVARGDQEAQDADYDKAIATYDDALKQAGTWPDLKTRVDALKKSWAIKSESHRTARKFVYEEWSKAKTVDDVDRLIERAEQVLKILRDVGDKLTPRKLHHGLVQAAGWIARRDEELRRSDAEDTAKQTAALKKLSTKVRALLNGCETITK